MHDSYSQCPSTKSLLSSVQSSWINLNCGGVEHIQSKPKTSWITLLARVQWERDTLLLILFSSSSSKLCAVAVPSRACCISEIFSSIIAGFTAARHQNTGNNKNDTVVESFAFQTVILTILCTCFAALPFSEYHVLSFGYNLSCLKCLDEGFFRVACNADI